MPYVNKGNHGRGRCPQCRKLYDKRQVNQRFCSAECKTMFHDAGGDSFLHQAKLIEKLVHKEMRAARRLIVREVLSEIKSPRAVLPAPLRAQLPELIAALQKFL